MMLLKPHRRYVIIPKAMLRAEWINDCIQKTTEDLREVGKGKFIVLKFHRNAIPLFVRAKGFKMYTHEEILEELAKPERK